MMIKPAKRSIPVSRGRKKCRAKVATQPSMSPVRTSRVGANGLYPHSPRQSQWERRYARWVCSLPGKLKTTGAAQIIMEDYLDALASDEKTIFSAIANYTFSLGYKAKRDKTRSIGYTFTHRKVKKHILRFSLDRGKPILRLKFFASHTYSGFFHEAIKSTIEEYDFKYTGCYGCGNCDGTQGYIYQYPDGREYYRCGTELIEISDIRNVPLAEILELIKKQHEYYLSGACPA
jgi:hypothetical protein